MNLLMIVLLLVVLVASGWSSGHGGDDCHSNCVNICESGELSEKCDSLCGAHCVFYGQTVLADPTEISCLLGCNINDTPSDDNNDHSRIEDCYAKCHNVKLPAVLKADDQSGPPSHQQVNIGVGCKGYGREFCYKKCRLHSHESIVNCLCACCKCTFPPH